MGEVNAGLCKPHRAIPRHHRGTELLKGLGNKAQLEVRKPGTPATAHKAACIGWARAGPRDAEMITSQKA